MKYILFLLLLSSLAGTAQGLYDIEVTNYNGQPIKMSSFKGNRLLIASVSLDNLSKGKLRYLDSLQQVYPALQVILVPVRESTDSADNVKVRQFRQAAKSLMVITSAERVKKSDGTAQNELMKWLTDVGENNHFNAEVNDEATIYFISKYGALYALFTQGITKKVITDVLAQPDVREYPYFN